MKKVLAMGLVLALCLCGCGEEQKAKAKVELPEAAYDALVTMTEVVDSYLDMEITAEEASTKVEQLRARSNIEELAKTDDDPKVMRLDIESNMICIIMSSIKSNEFEMKHSSINTGTVKEIGEDQNQLLEWNTDIKATLGIE